MNVKELKSLITEVMKDMAKESLKSKLKKLISEEIEEIKYKDEDCLAGEMEELDKVVKEYDKKCGLEKDDKGNYNINGAPPHSFSIRPKSAGIYDVLYYKDNTDRTKKLNLNLEQLKEFVKETLKNKEVNYVKKEYNKVADNSKDKVENTKLPIHHKFAKKEVKDTKNDEKNYTEQQVKDEKDMPEKPYRTVEKFKKQIENPIKGTKPDYTYPKQKDKKLVAKLKAYKGKARKKD